MKPGFVLLIAIASLARGKCSFLKPGIYRIIGAEGDAVSFL